MATVPRMDEATQLFVQLLKESDARMRSACPRPEYPDDFHLSMVNNEPIPNARPLKCWFNCLEAEEAGLGTTVYGWALWVDKLDDGVLCMHSQHHAVLRTQAGLVDVTPYLDEDGSICEREPILFLPDSRVPFDLERGAFPASFVLDVTNNRLGWAQGIESDGIRWLPEYGVMRIEADWRQDLSPGLRASLQI